MSHSELFIKSGPLASCVILGKSICLSGPYKSLTSAKKTLARQGPTAFHPHIPVHLYLPTLMSPSRSALTSLPPSTAWLPWALGSEFHTVPLYHSLCSQHGGHPLTEQMPVNCLSQMEIRELEGLLRHHLIPHLLRVCCSHTPYKGLRRSLYLRAFSDLPVSICLHKISQNYLVTVLVEVTPRASMPDMLREKLLPTSPHRREKGLAGSKSRQPAGGPGSPEPSLPTLPVEHEVARDIYQQDYILFGLSKDPHSFWDLPATPIRKQQVLLAGSSGARTVFYTCLTSVMNN